MNFHKDRCHLRELQLQIKPPIIWSAPYTQTQYSQFPAVLLPTHTQVHVWRRPGRQTIVFFLPPPNFFLPPEQHTAQQEVWAAGDQAVKQSTRHSLSKAIGAGCTLNTGTIVQLVHASGLVTCITATNYPTEISWYRELWPWIYRKTMS